MIVDFMSFSACNDVNDEPDGTISSDQNGEEDEAWWE